jgi:2-polyprenyl-6-methoxyphenol hydroxylase-like FAD-dependent oxidoreductase
MRKPNLTVPAISAAIRFMPPAGATDATETVPFLIVGAGPTGLTLAAQLRWFGVPFRIIDRARDRAGESRALAVQARTLEILDSLGLADPMVARGNRSARLALHLGDRRVGEITLGDFRATETRYPFILFISQAETERILGEHLAGDSVAVERGVELVSFELLAQHVACTLRRPDGREEQVRAGYLLGCDGAHSAVRKGAGFVFQGGSYPEDFVLGDVEADGPLEPGAINSFAGGGGVAMFFPLGSPTTWRVIGMRAGDTRHPGGAPLPEGSPIGPLTLEELQAVVALPTAGTVAVRDPAWLSHFRLHHRQIAHYRRDRVFLAGDAAHIHSPVGAQGMNTGIQDAWNLGWKLALVARGQASEGLLDSYEAERWPVGHTLLRYTDRVFSVFTRAMAAGRFASWIRNAVIARVLPRLFAWERLRSFAFGFVSELRIRYHRSPAITEGRPRLRHGPRAGARLPDAAVTLDMQRTSLQRAVVGSHLTLLLCGDPAAWNAEWLARLVQHRRGLIKLSRLTSRPYPGALVADGRTLTRLGVRGAAQYLIRPDGYIAFRCGGRDLDGLDRYLSQWFPEP